MKAATNLRKHGISFAFAVGIFLDPLRQEQIDSRNDYDEERWTVTGRVDGYGLFLIYTMRGTSIGIISARRAIRKDYEN